jgi:hypothetical protein
MSKKLIAVAAAAALALSALVGVAPASATAATITYTPGTGVGTGTSADPFLADVPYTNALTASANVLTVAVSGSTNPGDTVTVAITGTAKVAGDVISASTLIDVRNIGAATLTKTVTSAAQTLSFYVFDTKAETPSTVTVTVNETDSGTKSTTTSTKVFEAEAGVAHAVTSLTTPSTLAASTAGEISFKVTDVFGNELDNDTIDTAPTMAGTSGSPTLEGPTYSVSRKLWVGKVTSPANTRPFIVTLDGNGATSGPSNAGLGSSSVDNQLIVINNAAAAAANASATAQIAALTAQLAESRPKATSVTKKRFNTLARKWNAAFPSQKVALKK